MKKLLITITVFAMSFTMNAQENEGITLTVIIENVLNNDGYVLSALHNENTFMQAEGIKTSKEKAQSGELILTFENIQPGEYAFSVLHDANDNERMDFETNGMPKEEYAMSGNSLPMGPPTFTDAKFTIEEKDIELTLRF
ncbi:DUF2141 domain-containing protein [Maribacter hydrothermalis]|uniref:DUF2141 domain-containing protein n=1 Tax=Maribacter hydrothermalis TaxID=1836467 RepID=A0A1B7ZBX5_9FLAO|nr:DUF2141 domain-containing protein [Maribacter hydrothermalis]APQ16000.1 hypothetical protein BTR34_00990 [Maribacter hydrothermalis]OBR40417.1 hypothetical protein A9200_16195 [Maribacter hydrothermalis]